VVIWSLFTMTTPVAASATLPILLANRAMMGAGEGVTFPCVQKLVKGWVPADARSRALTLIYSGEKRPWLGQPQAVELTDAADAACVDRCSSAGRVCSCYDVSGRPLIPASIRQLGLLRGTLCVVSI
jgi:hypothetical protein